MKKQLIYLCGPTVYNDIHIGNARPLLVVDLFVRSLIARKIPFQYVQNITDIDDKIIAKAKLEKRSESEVALEYQAAFEKIMERLNVVTPNFLPTVTGEIDNIIDFIALLIKKDVAYVQDGNVLFDTSKVENYGSLFNIKLDKHQYEDTKIKKRNKSDFALWKTTKDGIVWKSPWGKGRPGWHTECAYFVDKYFGSSTIDFHFGGIDLKFPHHLNEDAQFRALHKHPITKEWKHVGHLHVDNVKMSKSIGNVITVKDFLREFDHNHLRYTFLTTNPFAPLNIDEELMRTKSREFKKILNLVKEINRQFTMDEINNKYERDLKVLEAIGNFKFAQASTLITNSISEYYLSRDINLGLRIVNTLISIGFDLTIQKWDQHTVLIFNKWKSLVNSKNYVEADKLRDILKKDNRI